MKVLITKDNKKFLYKEQDLHTKWGYVTKDQVDKANPGDKIFTNMGKELYVFEAGFSDLFSRIKRGSQVMLPKDISTIVGMCGINKKSRVLDAGSGSGATACLIGSIAKQVYSYELRTDHAKVAKSNVHYLGLKNVTIKNRDICEGIDERKLDVIIFDMPEPWWPVKQAHKALKPGGFLVNYSPNLTQTKKFVEELQEDFIYLKTTEIIEREWEVEDLKLRPKHRMLGHTGFLSLARKVNK